MEYKQAAQQALDVQNACNLSGVTHAYAEAMRAICDESNRLNKGTDWKNSHPIVTMHLLKMCELNGCGSTLHSSYDTAEKRCQEIARDSISTDDLRAELVSGGE